MIFMAQNNFKVIAAKNGVAIDTRCFREFGKDEYINADDISLYLSAMHYWNLEVEGFDRYNDKAREEAMFLFNELWRRGFNYKIYPEYAPFVAYDKIFHENGFCEDAKKSLRFYIEGKLKSLPINDLWIHLMMYSSLCGGNFSTVIEWLRLRMEKELKSGIFGGAKKGRGATFGLLRHYLVLNEYIKRNPVPENCGGSGLLDYWEKIYARYHQEEALLECTLIKAVLCHNPFISYKDDYPDSDYENLVRRPYFDKKTLKDLSAEGKIHALAIVLDERFKFNPKKEALPDLSEEIRKNDKKTDLLKKDWFEAEERLALEKTEKRIKLKPDIDAAKKAYAYGIYHYITGDEKSAFEYMSAAKAFKEKLSGLYYPADDINPADAAEKWILKKEKNEESFENIFERTAENIVKNPSDCNLMSFAAMLRSGYASFPPYTELWEKICKKVKYGDVFFRLDEGIESAEKYFRRLIENKSEYEKAEVAGAWLGLSLIDLADQNYVPENVLEFFKLDFEKTELLPEGETVVSFAEKAKNGNVDFLELIADYYLGLKINYKGVFDFKNIGILVFYCLEEFLKRTISGSEYSGNNYITGFEREELIDKWIKIEYEHQSIGRYFCEALALGINGLSAYAGSLLGNRETVDKMYNYCSLRSMISAMKVAMVNGYDVSKEKIRLEKILEDKKRNYEEREYREERERRESFYRTFLGHDRRSGRYSAGSSSSGSKSGIDSILDILERVANDGYTNKELVLMGERSAFDDVYDDNFRENVKNEFGDWW